MIKRHALNFVIAKKTGAQYSVIIEINLFKFN